MIVFLFPFFQGFPFDFSYLKNNVMVLAFQFLRKIPHLVLLECLYFAAVVSVKFPNKISLIFGYFICRNGQKQSRFIKENVVVCLLNDYQHKDSYFFQLLHKEN